MTIEKNTGTEAVAARFHELAQKEQWFEIQDELFADDVRSIEPEHSEHLPNAQGKSAVRKKGEAWVSRVEAFHGGSTSEPQVAGNFFTVARRADITVRGLGRMQTDEIMLYEVRDGKIVLEQFFY